jgi:hypothetical protein
MANEYSEKFKAAIKQAWEAQRELALKTWGNKYIQIQIFPDDSVFILDENDQIIPPQAADAIEGPENTYPQAIWLNSNPEQCVWFNGKLICRKI